MVHLSSSSTSDNLSGATDTARNTAEKAAHTGQNALHDTVDAAYDLAEKAGHKVHDLVDETSKQASQLYKSTGESIAEHPVRSVTLVAVGAFILGLLCSRLSRHA